MVPRSRATRCGDRGDVVAVLDSRCAPSTLASRRSASSCSCSARVGLVVGHPQQVELGAEPLGRAPGAADDPLRLRLRRDQREQALADRGRGRRVDQPLVAGTARRASAGIRLASTSSATWRSATSRSAARFSILKKLFSAAWTRSLG